MYTIKDNYGRVWTYSDTEGTWRHGDHLIGRSGRNNSRFLVWDGPSEYPEEFKSLRACMASIYDGVEKV